MPALGKSLLDWEPISRVRRNHALEHATLYMLGKKNPYRKVSGHSDRFGFHVLGDVSTEDLQAAVEEALTRLRAGEAQLAIHPGCGTNFAASGIAVGITTWLSMLNSGKKFRDQLERLPLAILLATIAMILSAPLGPFLQSRLTTNAHVGGLEITEIMLQQRGTLTVHRVKTRY